MLSRRIARSHGGIFQRTRRPRVFTRACNATTDSLQCLRRARHPECDRQSAVDAPRITPKSGRFCRFASARSATRQRRAMHASRKAAPPVCRAFAPRVDAGVARGCYRRLPAAPELLTAPMRVPSRAAIRARAAHLHPFTPWSEQKSCPAIDPIPRPPNRRAMPPRRHPRPAMQRRCRCRTIRRRVPHGAAFCNPRPRPRRSAPRRTFIRSPRMPRPARLPRTAIRSRHNRFTSTSTGAPTRCSSNRASRCSTRCANMRGSRARRRAATAGSAAPARCSSMGGASMRA